MRNPERNREDADQWRLPFLVVAAVLAIALIVIASLLAYWNAAPDAVPSTAVGWSANALTIGTVLWVIFVEGAFAMFLKREDKQRLIEEREQVESRLAAARAEALAEGRAEGRAEALAEVRAAELAATRSLEERWLARQQRLARLRRRLERRRR